ncbi:MAG: hypothetical protein QOI63_1828 [Thermoplasmata archaeon]|jgi:hypothetical protein|nr:hypothetical protein [Thermoplasmata archaeon]
MAQLPRRNVRAASEEAVTAPLGAILAIATVVMLALVYALFVSRLGAQRQDLVQSGAKADFSGDGYWISPAGPDGLPVDTGKLLVTIDGVQSTVPLAAFSASLGGADTWSVGTRLCIVGPGSLCYKHSGTTVQVTAIAKNNIVFSVAQLIEPGPGFSIGAGGGINVLRNGTVVLGMLGAQYACPTPMNVYVRLSIDGGATWASPLGASPVTPGGSGQSFNDVVPKGSTLVAEARGVGGPCGLPDITINSVDDPAQALVLKAGDPAPNYAPFMGQAPLASFLVPYVNTQTQTMVLAPNQAIILFDICCSQYTPPTGADFQDLVVLFTFP